MIGSDIALLSILRWEYICANIARMSPRRNHPCDHELEAIETALQKASFRFVGGIFQRLAIGRGRVVKLSGPAQQVRAGRMIELVARQGAVVVKSG
jgi:hypothetical protein